MKAERINLCSVVRASLIAAGYSTVKVVGAVNSALGELKAAKETARAGDGKHNKRMEFSITESVTTKYTGKLTTPLLFDEWHSQIAKAEKIAKFDSVSVPPVFTQWLDKFAKGKAEELETEKAETVV